MSRPLHLRWTLPRAIHGTAHSLAPDVLSYRDGYGVRFAHGRPEGLKSEDSVRSYRSRRSHFGLPWPPFGSRGVSIAIAELGWPNLSS